MRTLTASSQARIIKEPVRNFMNAPNFDKIREVILEMASRHGISLDEINDSYLRINKTKWEWSYRRASQQNEFENELFLLDESIRLYKAASKDGDWVTAEKGLLMASIASQNLYGFFDGLMMDLRTLMLNSDQFQWPEFPEDYKVPEKYGYKGL